MTSIPERGSSMLTNTTSQAKSPTYYISDQKQISIIKMSIPFIPQEVPTTVRIAQVVGITGAAFLAGTAPTSPEHKQEHIR
jgi:hypothetical protein